MHFYFEELKIQIIKSFYNPGLLDFKNMTFYETENIQFNKTTLIKS